MDASIIYLVVAVVIVAVLVRARAEARRDRAAEDERPVDAAWIAEMAARDDAAEAESDEEAGADTTAEAAASNTDGDTAGTEAPGAMPGDADYIEMEEVFYRRAAAGEGEAKLLRAYFPRDIMLLKSLLQSEQIPFRTEFDAMSGIMPGVQIANYNETYFYVLAADKPAALEVVASYLASKLADGGEPTAPADARGLAELILAGWRAPDNALRNSIEVFK